MTAPCHHNVFRYTDSVTDQLLWFCSLCGIDFIADGTLPIHGQPDKDSDRPIEQVMWVSPLGIPHLCAIIDPDTGLIYNPDTGHTLHVTQEMVSDPA
ncbi:hypothetical protein [Leifsonia sp. Leaf264]|uniref:hypothetical protein n=1 Tax=Leifsonia sp. Leaf264 TaxID=1736314 RepID=UPI0006FB5B2F|nr:hypothetical protein [Leifsonia sp. Leaf264]KQO98437.1 hypothetical protein ASF30_10270 [Leifsonia sp. Leaf264]